MRGAALLLALALGCGTAPAPPSRPLTPAEIASRSLPAVVLIRTDTGSLGSGFIIDESGLLATNFHVIAGSSQIQVTMTDGRVFDRVTVIDFDQAHDLAMLSIDQKGLPTLPLSEDPVIVGSRVVAIGNPQGFDSTVSDGLVSGIRRLGDLPLIQISAPISQGSSGGPVLDDRGRVIGVSTLIAKTGQNLNFAVPVRFLGELDTDRREARPRRAPAAPLRQPDALVRDCPPDEVVRAYLVAEQTARAAAERADDGDHGEAVALYRNAATDLATRGTRCGNLRQVFVFMLDADDGAADDRARARLYRKLFDGFVKVLLESLKGA